MNALRILLWPLRRRRDSAPPAAVPPPMATITLDEYERIQPFQAVSHGGTEVKYYTPTHAAKWRVDTLFTKEPDTLAWIAGFGRDDVLVDIGANVGMYAIWAAATRGTRVYAFEPESQNFAVLNRNIVANKLGHRVTAYCVALSNVSGFSLLNLASFGIAGSGHTYGEDVDHHLRARRSPHAQGCVATTVDQLVADGTVSAPTHIKIDVDGLEHKVLAGCRATLRDARLKSVLVEINSGLEQHRRLIDEFAAAGFTYSEEQVRAARRTSGDSAGVGNYVFRR